MIGSNALWPQDNGHCPSILAKDPSISASAAARSEACEAALAAFGAPAQINLRERPQVGSDA
jgi:hypothetical protein